MRRADLRHHAGAFTFAPVVSRPAPIRGGTFLRDAARILAAVVALITLAALIP